MKDNVYEYILKRSDCDESKKEKGLTAKARVRKTQRKVEYLDKQRETESRGEK